MIKMNLWCYFSTMLHSPTNTSTMLQKVEGKISINFYHGICLEMCRPLSKIFLKNSHM